MKRRMLPFFTWLYLGFGYLLRVALFVLFVLASAAGVVAIPILMFRLDWPAAFEFLVWGCGLPIFLGLTYYSIDLIKEDWKSFEEYREDVACSSRRQSRLIRLLRSDPSEKVRRSAADQCSNQEQLLHAAFFDPDRQVRLAATSRIQEEALLCAILVGSEGREEAVKSLENRPLSRKVQRCLADIALDGETPRLRILAAELVKEYDFALHLLRQSNDSAVRLIALKQMKQNDRRLEQQPYFLLLARTDANAEVRKAAAGMLRDLSYVRALVRLSADDAVRAVAAAQMSWFSLSEADQTLLMNAALETQENELQAAAVKGIRNADMLQIVLDRLDDSNVRRTALECIKRDSLVLERPEVFLTIALEAYNESVRRMAAELIVEPPLISRLLRESRDAEVRKLALNRTEDPDDIIWCALHDSETRLCYLAMERIPSSAKRLEIACANTDFGFFKTNIQLLIAEAIRDGGIPPEMENSIRSAIRAKDLMKEFVCPECGGNIGQDIEWEFSDTRYGDVPYSDLIQGAISYSCNSCRCNAGTDPSIPFEQFLQNHRKAAPPALEK